MDGLRLLFRFAKFSAGTALLAWFFSLPVVGVLLFLSLRGTLFFFGITALISPILMLVLSEWGVLRLLQAQLPRSYGLRNSYEMAYAGAGKILKARPALLTFPDPVPNVFVLRAWGGDGVILLSEGFISILDESELRFVLMRSIQHLRSAETVLQSACVFALTLIQRRLATPARGFRPAQALKSLLLFPWLRFYSSLAIKGAVTGRVGSGPSSEFKRGASKLARAEQLYGQQAFLPGLVYLGIER